MCIRSLCPRNKVHSNDEKEQITHETHSTSSRHLIDPQIHLGTAFVGYFLLTYFAGVINGIGDVRASMLLYDDANSTTTTNNVDDVVGTSVHCLQRPLPDIGFDHIAYREELHWAPDSILNALFALVLLRIAITPPHRRALIVTFLELSSALLILRALTVTLTTMPTPQGHCPYHVPLQPAHFLADPAIRFMGPGLSTWCHDLMFSGHASLFTLCASFVAESRTYAWRTGAWILWAFGIYTIIATRMHYTLDVWIACLISALLFQFRKRRLHAIYIDSNNITQKGQWWWYYYQEKKHFHNHHDHHHHHHDHDDDHDDHKNTEEKKRRQESMEICV